MTPILFELNAASGLAENLAADIGAEMGDFSRRQFPDGESYVRLMTDVERRDVIILCSLDRPDPKLAPLLFTAAAVRSQGARSVGLAAPYLAYMRQDKQFHPGEGVSSRTFAEVLSRQIDWLATVDPHLHRYANLGEIYTVPAISATAASPLAEWIRSNVDRPVIIGPDEESGQWVSRIAELAGARSTVLRKERSGDYSVHIDAEGLRHLADGTPVLVDDIASSAGTLIEAVELLKRESRQPPVCAVVHPIFAGDSYQRLLSTGVLRVVSTNTVEHETNAIEISGPLAEAVRKAFAEWNVRTAQV